MSQPEPEAEPEPEPEPEVQVPSGIPEAEPENMTGCGNADAEPHPEWMEAKIAWGDAWQAHIYIFFSLFLLLAVAALYELAKRKNSKFKVRYFSTLQVLVFVAAISEGFTILLDPYGSHETVTLPAPVEKILSGLATPCMVSADSFGFLTLIKESKIRFIHERVVTWKTVTIMCVIHFISNVTASLLSAYNVEAVTLLLLCNIYQCVWGLFLFIGFPLVGHRIIRNLIERSQGRDGGKEPLLTAAKLTYATSAGGLLLLVVHLYFILDMYNISDSGCFSDPWTWWSFQTVARVLELVVGYMLLFSTYDSEQQSRIKCLRWKRVARTEDEELQDNCSMGDSTVNVHDSDLKVSQSSFEFSLAVLTDAELPPFSSGVFPSRQEGFGIQSDETVLIEEM